MYQRVLGQRHPAVGHGVADQHAFVPGGGLIRPVGKVEDFTSGAYVFEDHPRHRCDVAVPWPGCAARVAVLA